MRLTLLVCWVRRRTKLTNTRHHCCCPCCAGWSSMSPQLPTQRSSRPCRWAAEISHAAPDPWCLTASDSICRQLLQLCVLALALICQQLSMVVAVTSEHFCLQHPVYGLFWKLPEGWDSLSRAFHIQAASVCAGMHKGQVWHLEAPKLRWGTKTVGN